jgi:cell division protein YceG involved in septum cleavage
VPAAAPREEPWQPALSPEEPLAPAAPLEEPSVAAIPLEEPDEPEVPPTEPFAPGIPFEQAAEEALPPEAPPEIDSHYAPPGDSLEAAHTPSPEPPPEDLSAPRHALPIPPRASVPVASGQSRQQPPPRRERSRFARLLAVLALGVVIVAVLLLVRSLLHSGHAKTAPRAAPVVKVLIPEGKTRAQIAGIAAKDGLSGSYRLVSRHSPLLDPTHYGAPARTPDLEGFLFPATYDMNPGESVHRLVEKQLGAFQENFSASDVAAARAQHLTPYQLLIVASMVEREAQIPSDRSKIAAVIYHRLSQGVPLGIDATIYYAVEQRTGIVTYTHELSEAQLQINSPYNTRTHVGLPPTPISNPGVASIEAAAHPARVPYLYYVAGADGCGEQVFSTTQAQFEVNAAAYRAAVAKNHGQPPTCKKK